jgi:hypothetical protein
MSEERQSTPTKFFKTRIDQELVGRWPNGDKIPGGPYTLTQVVLGVSAGVFTLWSKNHLGWTSGNVLMDLAITVGVVVAVIYLLKTVVPDEPGLLKQRSIGYATTTVSMADRNRTGSYRGKKYNTRPVRHRVRGRVLIDTRPTTASETAPAPVESALIPEPLPTPVASAPADQPVRRLSGVEHLLATTRH